jgi:hypothetical protein
VFVGEAEWLLQSGESLELTQTATPESYLEFVRSQRPPKKEILVAFVAPGSFTTVKGKERTVSVRDEASGVGRVRGWPLGTAGTENFGAYLDTAAGVIDAAIELPDGTQLPWNGLTWIDGRAGEGSALLLITPFGLALRDFDDLRIHSGASAGTVVSPAISVDMGSLLQEVEEDSS